ncbi:MAG: hypothetical protein ACI97A_003012 [Planctomycetota bacterium]|jgi:hypothetical protein
MSKMSKVLSACGVLLIVCVLGAAVAKSTTASKGPLSNFGVEVGTSVMVFDQASHIGTSKGHAIKIHAIDGWIVMGHLPGRKDIKGGNRFVVNLEDTPFQITSGGKPLKKK